MYVLYRCLRLASQDARVWVPALILSASLLGRFYLFRPQVFTYMLLAIFVLAALRHVMGKGAPLWVLPFLLILWANLHGGFIAGIGVIGLALGIELLRSWQLHGARIEASWRDTRAMLATLLTCVVASLATPMGWRIWPFLVTELGNPFNRQYIVEWQPVRLRAPGLDGLLMIVLVVVLAAAWALAQRRGVRLAGIPPWVWFLSCMPLIVMAFGSHRHIPILVIWAVPLMGLLAEAGLSARLSGRALRLGFVSVTAVILVPALLGAYFTLISPLPQIRITDDSLGDDRPFGVVEFMRANDLRGNAFVPLWWGAYFTWQLYPDILVSMDGRNDTLYPVEMIGENLVFYKDLPDSISAPLRYPTDFLLMPAGTATLPAIHSDDNWSLLYQDAEASLFVRISESHNEWIRQAETGELRSPTSPPPQLFR